MCNITMGFKMSVSMSKYFVDVTKFSGKRGVFFSQIALIGEKVIREERWRITFFPTGGL